MSNRNGKRMRRGTFVVFAAGLLAIAADCDNTPAAHELTILLETVSETTPTGQARVRCKYTELIRDAMSHKDGDVFHFTVDNQCGATQWVGVTFIGNLPLEGCTTPFPLLGWREFPAGRKDAGMCTLPVNETHCHRLEILVRSAKSETTPFAIPVPVDTRDACGKTDIKDHSLDFHDIPP